MIFLPLAVACSLGIAVIFKMAERRDYDRNALLTVNYAAGAVLALVLVGAAPVSEVDAGLVALGVAQGVLFIGGFWLFSLAIRRVGMGIAAGVMRLSVVVPVLAAWVVWGETPTPLQALGLALGGIAFFLIARPAAEAPGKLGPPPPSEAAPPEAGAAESPTAASAPDVPPAAHSRAALALLVLLFLAGGCVDVLMKTFDVAYGGTTPKSMFLLFVFGVAFVVGLGAVALRRVREGVWPRGGTLGLGVMLGVVNYGSADFFLRAIEALSAPVVFPANSISIVIGAALIGRFAWGERFSRANMVGLAVASVALVCLVG